MEPPTDINYPPKGDKKNQGTQVLAQFLRHNDTSDMTGEARNSNASLRDFNVR